MKEFASDIFLFLDPREFLRSTYKRKKDSQHQLGRKYSYKEYSKDLGLSASTHIQQYVSGKKNLSDSSVEKISNAFPLNKNQRNYFKNLVLFDMEMDSEKRQLLLAAIMKLRKKFVSHHDDEKSLDYLSEWYIPAIRELVALEDFDPDPKWIVEKLKGQISPSEATAGFKTLQKHQYIEFEPTQNKWVQKDTEVIIPARFESGVFSRLHTQLLKQASQSIWQEEEEKRDINASFIGIEEKEFENLVAELEGSRAKILEKYTSKNPDMVVQLGMQLLQLTKK